MIPDYLQDMKMASFDFGAQISACLGNLETKEKGYRPHSEVLWFQSEFSNTRYKRDWLDRKQIIMAPQVVFATIRKTQCEHMPEFYAILAAGVSVHDDVLQRWQREHIITPLFVETATIVNCSVSSPIVLSKKEGIQGSSGAAGILNGDKDLRNLLQKKSFEKIQPRKSRTMSRSIRFSWSVPFAGMIIPKEGKSLVALRSIPDIWPDLKEIHATSKVWRYEIQKACIEIPVRIIESLNGFQEELLSDTRSDSDLLIEEYLEIREKL
jgi:hypothetical protein